MGRKAGSVMRCVCRECGAVEVRSGCNAKFLCTACKPPLDPYTQAKRAAHAAVATARRAGKLPDPYELDCVDCGEPAIEYEHRDYSKPLDVVPICRRCNLLRGRALVSKAA